MPEFKGLKWVFRLVMLAWVPMVFAVVGRWIISALWVLSASLIAFTVAQIGESNQSGNVLPEGMIRWLLQHKSPVLLSLWLAVAVTVTLSLLESFASWIYTWIHLVVNKRVTPQVIEVSITNTTAIKPDASTAIQRWLLKTDVVYFLDESIAATLGNLGAITIAIFATYRANVLAGHVSLLCLTLWVLIAIPLTIKALRATRQAAQSHEIVGRVIRDSVALRMDMSRPSLLGFWLQRSSPYVDDLQRAIAKQGFWNAILPGSLNVITMATPYIAVIAVISTSRSAASAVAILLYLTRMTGPLSSLARVLPWIQQNLISVQRLFNMIIKQLSPLDKNARQVATISSLRLVNWVVRVGDNRVITYPDIEASSDSILCIVGPSGSGKSTLIKSMASLLDVERGELQLDGQAIDSSSSMWRETCGLLSQEPELVPGTIRDNLMGFADWTSTELIMNAANKIFSGVDGTENCTVGIDDKGVSVGQRRSIALLRCLGGNARVILLDEPVAGVDDSLVNILRDVMEEARRQGRIIILTAHEHDCKRLGLENGKIIRIESPEVAEPIPSSGEQ